MNVNKLIQRQNSEQVMVDTNDIIANLCCRYLESLMSIAEIM